MYINGAKVEQNHKVQEVNRLNSIKYSFTYQTNTLLSWSDISVAFMKDRSRALAADSRWPYRFSRRAGAWISFIGMAFEEGEDASYGSNGVCELKHSKLK